MLIRGSVQDYVAFRVGFQKATKISPYLGPNMSVSVTRVLKSSYIIGPSVTDTLLCCFRFCLSRLMRRKRKARWRSMNGNLPERDGG